MSKFMLRPKGRILIIALNGIGNTLLATPLIENIRRNYPKAKIAVLTLSDSAGLLKNNCSVDEVINYDRRSIFSRVRQIWELKKQKFDMSIYTYPNTNIRSALMALAIGARTRVNFYYLLFGKWVHFFDNAGIMPDLSKHDIDKYNDLLRHLGFRVSTSSMSLNYEPRDEMHVDSLLKGKLGSKGILIGMHLGSKEALRIWPIVNFAKLVRMLSTHKKIKIALVGTSIEEQLIKGHREFRLPAVINLINKTTIGQTAALLKRCRIFVGTDSAPSHIAVAVGTKVISIYLGPHIMRTAPYGKEHIVLFNDKTKMNLDKNKNHIYVDKITPELVYSKIVESLRL